MALFLDVKVVPSSGRQQCCLGTSGLKCYLKSPPEKGKANKELISLFAKKLKAPKESIVIVKGETSRNKRIRIEEEKSKSEVYIKLGIEVQTNFV
jgi:uncharacterized protein